MGGKEKHGVRSVLGMLLLVVCVPWLCGVQQCPPTNGTTDGTSDGTNDGTTDGTSAFGTMEVDTFNQINQQRISNGLAALVMNETVRTVARNHSQDMIDRGFFDHTNPDGLGVGDRVTAAGVAWQRVGENIASNSGYADPVTVAVTGWMNSAGHRANILTAEFTHTGIGIAQSASGAYYFTQVFFTPP